MIEMPSEVASQRQRLSFNELTKKRYRIELSRLRGVSVRVTGR
jgi:hypothetical protein